MGRFCIKNEIYSVTSSLNTFFKDISEKINSAFFWLCQIICGVLSTEDVRPS
jgi:hypothetical protein